MKLVKLYIFALLLFAPAVLAQTTVQFQDHSGNPPAPTEGVPFEPFAYYKAKADFARERMRWEELEAQRYARYAARLNLRGGDAGSMSQVIEKAMSGCSSEKGADGGFWANIANRMGRSKECRERQTTARVMMCNLVALETGEMGIMNYCAQMAENDNQWIPFWTQALRSGVTIAGIHYGAGALADMIGLGKAAIDANKGLSETAILNPVRPQVVEPRIVEPTVVSPEIVQPHVVEVPAPEINQPIEGGGGG